LCKLGAGGELFEASGFAITNSGYFVTVLPTGFRGPDSVRVTLADQGVGRTATVVRAIHTPGANLALLRISEHTGSSVNRVDWSGTAAGSGLPSALVGFPGGMTTARDGDVVRTSIVMGIFSRVTLRYVTIDGFNMAGLDGGPLFNEDGIVVAVNRVDDLRGGVRVREIIPLLPQDAMVELGLN